MKFIKYLLLSLVIITIIFSCSENEEITTSLNKKEITNFSITEKSENKIKAKAFLNNVDEKVLDHGVIWYKNYSKKFRKRLGGLKEKEFETFINNNLIKDSVYYVYPFIKVENEERYGDTLSFKSDFTSMLKIKNFMPKNGFVGDTITINGENFCDNDFITKVFTNNSYYNQGRIISKSDSIIKFLVPPYLKTSKIKFFLESCNVSQEFQEYFTVNAPQIDSLETGLKYVGDKLNIYGENIHSSVAEVWLDNIKADIVNETESTKKITVVVPRGLSKGKVDIKIKIIDREVLKENYFQTTTPYIERVLPKNIGFLDTIAVKGKYLIQKNKIPEISIGEKLQKVINYNSDSLKVVVNNYFYLEEPKLALKVDNFVDTTSVNVLSPKILKFDKEKYHLTDNLQIYTDAFIESNNLYVGGNRKGFGDDFNITPSGLVTISLKNWLDITSYFYSYKIKEGGKLPIRMKNNYGEDVKNIQLYAPLIKSIDDDNYKYGDYITIKGDDFAHSGFNKIYIDGELVNNPHNSSYTVGNNEIKFELLKNTTPGEHELYVEVAGQKSNIVKFKIKESKINSINSSSGTRRDTYKIVGENIKGLKVYADEVLCDIIYSTEMEVDFRLPYYNKLTSDVKITAKIGDQKFDVANFSGIESHDLITNSTTDENYYGKHVAFSDSENWFYVNNRGVFRFDFSTKKWESYDSNTVPFNTPVYGEKQYVNVKEGKAYFLYGKILFIYNINDKKWEQKELKVNVKNGVVYNQSIYFVSFDDNKFYKYNLDTEESIILDKPADLNLTFESMTFGDNKIFINSWQGNMYYFDLQNNTFTNIGRPRNFLGSYGNVALKYKNNKLYFFGGWTDAGKEYRVYEYSLINKSWKEKTPMLMKAYNLSVFERDNIFYLGLGNNRYGYTNKGLDIYYLDKDPH